LSPALRDWIRAALARAPLARSGSLLSVDANYKVVETREFTQALITSLSFPATDASARDAARVVLTFSPERVVRRAGDGTRVTQLGVKTNNVTVANFRFDIDGFSTALSRTLRVDVPEISQELRQDAVGSLREPTRSPRQLQVGNLSVVLPESSATPFYDWLEDFVVRGNHAQSQERSGTLEYLSANANDTVLGLSFHGLGIVRVAAVPTASSSPDQIARVQVELYCEELLLL
jgi:hypothetical protein